VSREFASGIELVPEAAVVALTTPLILPGTTPAASALSGYNTLRTRATPLHKAVVIKHLLITIAAFSIKPA
jgi:hypothetical protein